MFNDSLPRTAEEMIEKPLRWSISAVSLALMTALALVAVIQSTSSLELLYGELISEQQNLQQANVLVAMQKKEAKTPELLTLTPQESKRIIVKYKEKNDAPGLDIAAERANIEKAQGLVKLTEISGIGATVYEVSEDDTAGEVVDRLKANKHTAIEYVEEDVLMPPAYTPNDPSLGSAWHVTKIEAPTAWDAIRGENIIIGIADSGVDCTHPDLAQNCVSGWNSVSANTDTSDVNGHGTAVAGTAAEVGNNAAGSAGIAYAAKIMPLRITNSADGYAYWSSVAQAVTWAADHGARVVSNSYGSWQSASVESAANYLRDKGGVFVAAAMNDGASLTNANSPSIIVVSATESNDVKASWSNYGTLIDVSAPGNYIYTTTRGGGYGQWMGTSFATPITAGVLGLILAKNPTLTASEAEQVLFSSADDIGNAGWDAYYGHGRVNAARAVTLASSTRGSQGAPDTIAPSTPTNLTVSSVTSSAASLTWGASTDNVGVTGYNVYRNGTKLTTVTGTSYTNTGLSPNTTYTYMVSAIDKAGNESQKTTQVSATTAALEFGISSHSVPTKTSTSATVAVSLTKPGTVTVKYGTSASSLTMTAESATAATAHSVVLSNLTAATTYYYQVVATDGATTVTSPTSSFKTNKATGGGKPRR